MATAARLLPRGPRACDPSSVSNTLTSPNPAENLTQKAGQSYVQQPTPEIDKASISQKKLRTRPSTKSVQKVQYDERVEEYHYFKGKLYIASHVAVSADVERAVNEEVAPRALRDIRALGLDCAIPKLCIAGHKKTSLKPAYIVLCNDSEEQKKLKKLLESRQWKGVFARYKVKPMVLLDAKSGSKTLVDSQGDE